VGDLIAELGRSNGWAGITAHCVSLSPTVVVAELVTRAVDTGVSRQLGGRPCS